MSFLQQASLGTDFAPFVAFRQNFGFIPNLFQAQTLLPRVIEAQARIAGAVVISDRALTQRQKQLIPLLIAGARESSYCLGIHFGMLRSLGVTASQLERLLENHRNADLPAADQALLDFSLKLNQKTPAIGSQDIESLRSRGFDDGAVLEAIQVTALARFLCTLSAGLGPDPETEPLFAAGQLKRKPPSTGVALPVGDAAKRNTSGDQHLGSTGGPYLRAPYLNPKTFAPFAFFRANFGFVPNIFRAQTLRPDVVEAEAEAVAKILLTQDVLTRMQKEYILLVISAAALNTYCVAVHCEMLRGLGVPSEESDQIAVYHRGSSLSEADKVLLDFSLKLGADGSSFGREDIEGLRRHGFNDTQILEAVVMTAMTNFLNTLQVGLGTVPDFEPRLLPQSKKMHLEPSQARPSQETSTVTLAARAFDDADADTVARAKAGDLEAFEVLIRRHARRVYRTLVALLGDRGQAEDAMQDTYLSAFQHLGQFQGRSKFSTWLISIARNTAFQRLRDLEAVDSLDEGVADGEEDFRPRQVRAWQDDPEQSFSRAEIRELVERGIGNLPAKYRVVLVLRDLEQLGMEEVAEALKLSVPATKARLLRGRLMLRERLAPHFAAVARRTGS